MVQAREQLFHEIYAAELKYLWNSLHRLGVPAHDLEDVAHETMLSVYRKLTDYDASRPLRPWLFGFAYRTAADYRKRVHRRHERLAPDLQFDEPVHQGPSAEQEIARQEERSLVAEALRSVPIDRSAVFVMMEIDGHSAPEVAETLGIPLNTVYSRIRVARSEFSAAVRRLRASRGGP